MIVDMASSRSEEVRAGVAAMVPMMIGAVPFGLVAGATPVSRGLGGGAAVGLSSIVFAGASQLAVVDVLSTGGSVAVAVLAAWTINLRMILYSASVAPYLRHESKRRRLAVAYLLTDQAYAMSVARWARGVEPERRLPYYFGAACTLWLVWMASTVVGALVGASVPASIPLDFAIPLVFLVLLVPAVTTRPSLVAAVVAGAGAVTAAELGAGHMSIFVGAVSGIVAGTIADVVVDERPSGPGPTVEP